MRLACLLITLSACSANPFDELRQQGADRYLDLAKIEATTSIEGVTTTTFTVASGPRCLDGSPYRASTRPGNGKDLLIFLNGGGACWSELCIATESAQTGLYAVGILNQGLDSNPFADFDLLFTPYCDGSLFAGDVAIDSDDDGEPDRFQFGLRNLSAALDLGKTTYPSPERIVIAGSSGGGFGTIAATILTRLVWPEVPILIINDSGVGITRGHEPDWIDERMREWNVDTLIPASCADCTSDGHLTELLAWQLEQDANLKIAAFSYQSDNVIASLFLQVTFDQFTAWLKSELGDLHQRFPEQFAAFVPRGNKHTMLYSENEMAVSDEVFPGAGRAGDLIRLGGYVETQIGGQSVGQWMQAMLDGSSAWTHRFEDAP